MDLINAAIAVFHSSRDPIQIEKSCHELYLLHYVLNVPQSQKHHARSLILNNALRNKNPYTRDACSRMIAAGFQPDISISKWSEFGEEIIKSLKSTLVYERESSLILILRVDNELQRKLGRHYDSIVDITYNITIADAGSYVVRHMSCVFILRNHILPDYKDMLLKVLTIIQDCIAHGNFNDAIAILDLAGYLKNTKNDTYRYVLSSIYNELNELQSSSSSSNAVVIPSALTLKIIELAEEMIIDRIGENDVVADFIALLTPVFCNPRAFTAEVTVKSFLILQYISLRSSSNDVCDKILTIVSSLIDLPEYFTDVSVASTALLIYSHAASVAPKRTRETSSTWFAPHIWSAALSPDLFLRTKAQGIFLHCYTRGAVSNSRMFTSIAGYVFKCEESSEVPTYMWLELLNRDLVDICGDIPTAEYLSALVPGLLKMICGNFSVDNRILVLKLLKRLIINSQSDYISHLRPTVDALLGIIKLRSALQVEAYNLLSELHMSVGISAFAEYLTKWASVTPQLLRENEFANMHRILGQFSQNYRSAFAPSARSIARDILKSTCVDDHAVRYLSELWLLYGSHLKPFVEKSLALFMPRSQDGYRLFSFEGLWRMLNVMPENDNVQQAVWSVTNIITEGSLGLNSLLEVLRVFVRVIALVGTKAFRSSQDSRRLCAFCEAIVLRTHKSIRDALDDVNSRGLVDEIAELAFQVLESVSSVRNINLSSLFPRLIHMCLNKQMNNFHNETIRLTTMKFLVRQIHYLTDVSEYITDLVMLLLMGLSDPSESVRDAATNGVTAFVRLVATYRTLLAENSMKLAPLIVLVQKTATRPELADRSVLALESLEKASKHAAVFDKY